MNRSDLIRKTLDFEGGYVNDPNDAGGETNFGISKRQYPSVDIKNLTKEAAVEIYSRDYFDRVGLGLLTNPEVAWKVFDIGVNMGTGTAVRFLQQIVDIKEDGVLGPQTAALVNAADPKDTLKQLATKQLLRYADIVAKKPSNIGFFKGWVRRAMEF